MQSTILTAALGCPKGEVFKKWLWLPRAPPPPPPLFGPASAKKKNGPLRNRGQAAVTGARRAQKTPGMDKEAFEGGRDTSASDIPANVSRRADPAGARTCSADPPRQQLAATTPRTAIGPAPKKEKRGRANCSADAAPPPLPPLQRARARTRSLSPPPPLLFHGPASPAS